MAKKKGAFTGLQKRFVAEFVRDGNATQAAIRAGCPPASARKQASRWRTAPEFRHVQDAIAIALSDCLSDAKDVRRQAFLVLKQLSFGHLAVDAIAVAAREGRLLADVLDECELAMIASFSVSTFQDEGLSVKVKPYNRLQSLALLLKHFGTEDGAEAEDAQAAAQFDLKLSSIIRRLEADEEEFLAALNDQAEIGGEHAEE